MHKTIKYISFLSQFGFSLISPIIIMIFLSTYIRDYFELGNWVVLLGIFLGLGSAFTAAVKFYKYAMKAAEESEREEML